MVFPPLHLVPDIKIIEYGNGGVTGGLCWVIVFFKLARQREEKVKPCHVAAKWGWQCEGEAVVVLFQMIDGVDGDGSFMLDVVDQNWCWLYNVCRSCRTLHSENGAAGWVGSGEKVK